MSTSARLAWIFFDLGGTLVDEEAAQQARLVELSRLLARRGIALSPEALRERLELESARFAKYPFRALLEGLAVPAAVLAELRAGLRYDHRRERLFPGVASMLERLAASYRLGVIANQSLGSEQRLQQYGIERWFSVVAASAELGMEKPDPGIFEWALRRAGCAGAGALMVGDRIDNDVAPARRLGMRTVHVLQGLGRFHVARAGDETPHHTIEAITELDAVLAARMAEPSNGA